MVPGKQDDAAERLLIAGASVRAAAHSTLRAGYRPLAIDQFSDLDLVECCPAIRVATYPAGLIEAARAAPPSPWFYTGGIENHPQLVDEISSHHTLLGNSGSVLRHVRDPWHVSGALQSSGLRAPELARSPVEMSGPAGWLRKPLSGAGGYGIRWEEPSTAARRQASERCAARADQYYYQRYVVGTPCSAAFVAAAGRSELLGVTRQLIGTAWSGATGFRYAGSIGPVPVPPTTGETFRRIGACLAEAFSLSGLFGVDAILNDEAVWPVEVNPRYTASMEVLERGLNIEAVARHVAACRHERLLPVGSHIGGGAVGKAILYARSERTVTERFVEHIRQFNNESKWPVVADIPPPGARVPLGGPVVTVFAEAAQLEEIEPLLRIRVDQIRQHLEFCPPAG